MKLEKYHNLFQAQVEVLEEVGVTIEDESLMNSIAQENGWIIPDRNDRLLHEIKIWWCILSRELTHITGHI